MMKQLMNDVRIKRALWSVVNSVMALTVAVITYYSTQDMTWAIVILPIAHALSQFATKELNNKFKGI